VYRPSFSYLSFDIDFDGFYTLIISSFGVEDFLSGILTIESDTPIKIKKIQDEGQGMKKTLITVLH
jgi:hypothetical protein